MKLTCPKCPMRFDDKELLRLHIQARHTAEAANEITERTRAAVQRRGTKWSGPSKSWYRREPSLSVLADGYRPKDAKRPR